MRVSAKMMWILGVLTCFSAVFAFAAEEGGVGTRGGGEADCENKIHSTRRELLRWIDEAQFEGLILPSGVSRKEYTTRMKRFLAEGQVVVACEHRSKEKPNPIQIGGVPKLCVNTQGDLKKDVKPRIDCDFEGVMAIQDDSLFRTLHHEIANFAGIEKYLGPISDYSVSDQVALYAKEVKVWKLGKRKRITKADGPCLNLPKLFAGLKLEALPTIFNHVRVIPDGTTVSGEFYNYIFPYLDPNDTPFYGSKFVQGVIQNGCESIQGEDSEDFKVKISRFTPTTLELEVKGVDQAWMKFELISDTRLKMTISMYDQIWLDCSSDGNPGEVKIEEKHMIEGGGVISLDGSPLKDVTATRDYLDVVYKVARFHDKGVPKVEREAVCRERGKLISVRQNRK